jgi:hypothetical protein
VRVVVAAVLVAACGGPVDDCARIYEKLRASIPEFHKDETVWLRKCRAETEPPSTDPELACTLEADSASAVRRCMRDTYGRDRGDSDTLERYAAEQEALAKAKEAQAKAAAAQAAVAADEARQRVDALERELDVLNKRFEAVRDGTQPSDADHHAQTDRLIQLRLERDELERRIAEAKAAAARVHGVTVSKDCIDNPLAKGCP